MELYLFYHEVMSGRDADTLYKLELPSLPISELQPPEELLSPILELPMDKYPHSMGCVQLDSKLYFFGGSFGVPLEIFDYYKTEGDLTDQRYPSNVYVFDTNSQGCGDVVLNRVASMTTGKPEPFGFVANGMIYVIGGSVRRSYKYSNNSIKRFERFNPADEKWEVLDDSPIRRLTNCVGATVVEGQHKVLITAWQGYELVRIVYDFLHDRWDSECLIVSHSSHPYHSPYPYFHIYASDYNGGGQYLYGFRYYLPFPVPMKVGPLTDLKELDQIHKLPIVDISAADHSDWKVQAFSRRISPRTKYRMLRLSDGHFCYVVTGQVCAPDGPCFPCPHTRKVIVTIVKELSNPVGVQEEAEGRAFSFEAKILCIKDYFMKTKFHGDVELGGCFIFGSGDKHG